MRINKIELRELMLLAYDRGKEGVERNLFIKELKDILAGY